MVSLADFGYDTMTVDGVEAKGHRPLLIVLTEFDGRPPLAHVANYYDELVFNSFPPLSLGTLGRSVNGYYMNVTVGRFVWTRAGDVIGPLHLGEDLHRLPLPERLAQLIPVIGANYDFGRVAANDRAQSVSADQLSILVIDNDSTSSGQTTGRVHGVVPSHRVGDVTVQGSFIGSRPSLTLIAHELCHQLGTHHDLYGYDSNRNASLTLMGFEAGDDDMRTWHLDPWHKMRLGWAEPSLCRLDTYGLHKLPVANSLNSNAVLLLYDGVHGLNEFFMIEYRSRTAMDEYVPARGGGQIRFNYDADVADDGVAIWHVYLEHGEPVELPVYAPGRLDHPPIGYYKSVFADSAPDIANGVPAFVRGDPRLWKSGQTTPLLRWLDGSETTTRLRIGQYDAASKDVVVELLGPSPFEKHVPKSPDRVTTHDPRDGRIQTSRSGHDMSPRNGGFTPNRK